MKIQAINPATEAVIKEYESHSFDDAEKVVMMSRQAQQAWAALNVQERCVPIKKLAQALRLSAEECARLITVEMGKPITQARAEIEKCAWLCEYYAQNAPKFLAHELIQTEAKKSYLRFDPLGVVLGVMPWNFPFWQVVRFAVPALVAGNVAVLKHASNVPGCSLKLQEVFEAAGFPKHIFTSLLIDSKISNRLIEEELVDAISLTGSTGAGSSVAEHAGRHLKKCVLELGGSDPFIVLADADVKNAAQLAVQARMINTGQSCIAAKRFIIEKKIADEFTTEVGHAFNSLKLGDPMDETTTVGPLAKQELRTALEKQLEDATSKGAHILIGGKKQIGKGYFFEPTLINHTSKDMAVSTEEVFGPLMAVMVVENKEEALALANQHQYGLGASIWTRNVDLAEEMAGRIDSGFVSINGIVKSDPRLPFGGVKKSGYGRELGSYGIKEFVNIKTIVIN